MKIAYYKVPRVAVKTQRLCSDLVLICVSIPLRTLVLTLH